MRRMTITLGLMSMIGSLGAAEGCGTKSSMPGTALGTFSIEATLSSDTCGDGLGAPSPWSFDVELSKDDDTLYWKQDGAMVSGSISSEVATISGSQTSEDTTDAGVVTCAMTRADTIKVNLGAETDVTSISGTVTFVFSVVSGTSCSSELAANGGSYDTLPCTISYSYEGTRTKAP
ncbi:MAG: hypothetical protein U0165_13385 [Polyangiaceae bacterium]